MLSFQRWLLINVTSRREQDLSKSPKSVKKLLPKRKPERKQSEEEFALRKSRFTELNKQPSHFHKCFFKMFLMRLVLIKLQFSLLGTAALEEDAQILKVIEAYCTSAKTRQTLNSSKKPQYFISTRACSHEEKLTLEGCCCGGWCSAAAAENLSLTLVF